MQYYATKKAVKNGVVTFTNKYGEKTDMEYQYCLFRASATKNEAKDEMIALEWGTVEEGALEGKVYKYATPEPDVSEL